MTTFRNLLLLTIFITATHTAFGQDDKQKAKDLGMAAIKLEDENKPDEALPLLQQARALDPDNYNYPYEVAFCYNLKKDYRQAAETLEKVIKMKGARDECYQLLGNTYDMSGDSVKALATYAAGLKLFPKSGRLYLETGNIWLIRQDYDKALPYYEKGIDADPAYTSNYYRAGELFMSSAESIWGMMYGEIFMNLERNTERTAKMSKWLYENYKTNIVIKSDTALEVHFCNNNNIDVDDLKGGQGFKLPFSMMYEPLVLLSILPAKEINMETLCRMRKNFIDQYYEKEYNKTYPNVLFAYQHAIEKAGHLDAYNHWILMKGDEAAFTKWRNTHQDDWAAFATWFKEHPLEVTDDNKFVRGKM